MFFLRRYNEEIGGRDKKMESGEAAGLITRCQNCQEQEGDSNQELKQGEKIAAFVRATNYTSHLST